MTREQEEQEIREHWQEEYFQDMHGRARGEVLAYMQELNRCYEAKKGYGFIRMTEERMKNPESIRNKLERKKYDRTFETAKEKLNDISGVRVVCYCIREVYWAAKKIASDERYPIVKFKDYIRKPKKSGYESYHIVLEVPVMMEGKQERVRVELQLRTFIMDAWAELDSRICYKRICNLSQEKEKSMEKYQRLGRKMDKLMEKILYEEYEKI